MNQLGVAFYPAWGRILPLLHFSYKFTYENRGRKLPRPKTNRGTRDATRVPDNLAGAVADASSGRVALVEAVLRPYWARLAVQY